jgi:hypothetical protein
MSKDKDLNYEMREMLTVVSTRVAQQYVMEQNLLSSQPENREPVAEVWDVIAQEHPPFAGKITLLKERLQTVAETRKKYPGYAYAGMVGQFGNVHDPFAKNFLGNILLSRVISFKNYFDGSVDWSMEASLMASELGLEHGWESQKARSLSFKHVVESVLLDRLRITPHDTPIQ